MSKLVIENLHVEIDGKEILKGVDLVVDSHEVHALMGPNGHGKSTLLAAIMGHPRYEVTEGSITLDGEDVLEMNTAERSKAGLFLGMQYPQEVPGVLNSDFLRAAMNAHRETPIDLFKFIKEMDKYTAELEMDPELAHRYLNEGFSGGEKKRNEIMQMRLLNPKFALLDEIDSGLDIDALRIVGESIRKAQSESSIGLLVISHYGRFYDLVQPTNVNVLMDGRIVMSGDKSLADRIDSEGYEGIAAELGISIEKTKEVKKPVLLENCATSTAVKRDA
ncbi:MAG: Fe-S cluster assembly ATPase SufC [Erysipelothrix sp.]|nr:Fe-S cluster assembly ATPase SufC [Erysipelothrix sp.]